ncbi:hypothetical protein IG193_04115 [Infirmifilum lucidum]|uniref:Uncharacterized protein n=1 Tax=Infirmifilum lucidum TaxID=2776706 RepID=A0A7L9FIV0_9CREN|nr:hypothetical protein [Infirmifilum lucidum]QOJ79647.1 hypothetical protein IG193_04115 [Infirmifilum lucidum]
MSVKRPFAQVGQQRSSEQPDKPSLPLPPPPLEPRRQAGGFEDIERGIKNLEDLLRSIGFDGSLAERVRSRLSEIDREINKIELEISKLESEKNRLLTERDKILSVIRAFSGVH